jgi:hypothetical protein
MSRLTGPTSGGGRLRHPSAMPFELPFIIVQRENAMKKLTLISALCAACFATTAFAQGASDAAAQGLQAGDNAQGETQPHQSGHKGTHHKWHKSHASTGGGMSSSAGTKPGGSTTPAAPGAPVSASGSGQ